MESNSKKQLTPEQIRTLDKLKKEYESAEPYTGDDEPPDLYDCNYPPEIEARKRATSAKYFLEKYGYL